MVSAVYRSDHDLTKYTKNLTLRSKLWSVSYEYFN